LNTGRCDVLLVAADWQSRALLLAELQEEGCEVIALPGLRYALPALLAGRVHPRLILFDVQGDEDATPAHAEQLRELAPDTSLVLLVGAHDLAVWLPLQDQVKGFMQRPVTVGDVAKAVRRHLTRTPNGGNMS